MSSVDLSLPTLSSLVLALALVGCGGQQAAESGSGSESTDSATSSEGESSTGTATEDSGTETGEPGNACDACAEDELCVAHANDFCTEEFGFILECVPAVAACDAGKCSPDCLDQICGNDICPPPCGPVPGVDVWCTGAATNCDPLAQDCPEGEKCVPFASSGGTYDDNKCVPITGSQMPGEPCTSGGRVEAQDDCDGESMCWAVQGDLSMGTCYAFCEPGYVCPEGQGCLVANEGVVNLCHDSCRPHHPEDCKAGAVCTWANEQYLCLENIETLEPNAPCMEGETCAPGQACVPASDLDACMSASCCTDLCDTAEPDPCPAPLTCQPWFEQGQAPAGLETMGSCRLP
jgi:hypothetical protein